MKKLERIGGVARETRTCSASIIPQSFDFDASPVTTPEGFVCYFYTTCVAGIDPRC